MDVPSGAFELVDLDSPDGAEVLAAFVLPLGSGGEISGAPKRIELARGVARFVPNGEPTRVMIAWTRRSGFDYLNPEACAALIDQVHGEFARRLPQHLGNTIRGSFQDELQAMPLWSPRRRVHGQERLRPTRLPSCALGRLGRRGTTRSYRHQKLWAALAEAALFRPMHDWHASR